MGDEFSTDITAYFALIVLISVAYGRTFGGFQEAITQSVVDALAVKSRYRRVTNLAVGMVIALLPASRHRFVGDSRAELDGRFRAMHSAGASS